MHQMRGAAGVRGGRDRVSLGKKGRWKREAEGLRVRRLVGGKGWVRLVMVGWGWGGGDAGA